MLALDVLEGGGSHKWQCQDEFSLAALKWACVRARERGVCWCGVHG
jgi:hypothetical protein